MSDRLVSFVIPGEFVVGLALPTLGELRLGFDDGWIDAEGVVTIALARYQAGVVRSDAEEQIALVLSDELDLVADLLASVPGARRRDSRFWLLAVLAWLLEKRDDLADPLEHVEMVYADFGYPTEIEGLTRYMPVSPDQAMGSNAVVQRWSDWVSAVRNEYRSRDLLEPDERPQS